ncbi:tyrosine-type recombinase/integrase [Marinisporobacter balticus]|uniref:Integrase/recombinase XerD n=1 Tax=Marinisporobacter balticus TaxID=2018667 RepID=A0A4R2KGC7_9FIRM|nr:tyrosine-type recombinase/integrase [Marinisporobacter balticus]TCO69479.1 integrase/recombinase XerD [Marinisporobacter balticus]
MFAEQMDIFSIPKPIAQKQENNNITDNQRTLKRYRMHCKSKGLTPESLKAIIDNDLRLFVSYIGEKALDQVTHIDVQDFMLYCSDDRENGDEALGRKFTSINMFYKTLIKQEVLTIKNPCDKLDKPKKRKKQRGHITVEEYKKIMEHLDKIKDLRGAAIMSLFFTSGCRLSEIWQLNRTSLDFQSRRFKVVGKGLKERICVFSEDAKERILKYLNSRTDDLQPLFISRQRNRLAKKSIQDFFKVTGERVVLSKRISPHLARHGVAMALIKKDMPLEVIQRLLGHASIATTQIYAHMDMDTVQIKIDSVNILE